MTTAKAWIGATLAAISAVGVALKTEHGKLSFTDIPIILGAFIAGWQGVYWTPREKGTKP